MTDRNNNPAQRNIEKYSGTFSQENSGCTIFLNETINSITNMCALGLYSYLAARPSGWDLNPRQLAKHFECSKDTIYKNLDYLMEKGLITRTLERVSGKFDRVHYSLKIRGLSPCPVLPDTVSPDTIKSDTYKTKKSTSKEKDKKHIPASSKTGSKKVLKDYEKDERFMRFYSAYPKKEDPWDAWKAFKAIIGDDDELLERVIADIELRKANHTKWQDKQFIKYPAVYLRKGEFDGEIFNAYEASKEEKDKKKAIADQQAEEIARQSQERADAERKRRESHALDAANYQNVTSEASKRGREAFRKAAGLPATNTR